MAAQPPRDKSPRQSEDGQTSAPDNHVADANIPPDAAAATGSTDETQQSQKLTPDEQMALYEKELKETDWGHQPC